MTTVRPAWRIGSAARTVERFVYPRSGPASTRRPDDAVDCTRSSMR